jgi:hypothetical protein
MLVSYSFGVKKHPFSGKDKSMGKQMRACGKNTYMG